MGRKMIKINWEEVRKMCEIQCTQKELCAVLGICEDTLQRACKREQHMTWTEFFNIHRQGGRTSLRRAQWQKAVEKQDSTMLIFLGKNFLGQADKIDNTTTVNAEQHINVDFSKLTKEELQEMLKDDDDDD